MIHIAFTITRVELGWTILIIGSSAGAAISLAVGRHDRRARVQRSLGDMRRPPR